MNNKNMNLKTNRRKALRRQRQVIMGMCTFICIILIIVAVMLISSLMNRPDTTELPISTDSTPVAESLTPTPEETSIIVEPTPGPSVTVSQEEREQMLATLENDIAAYIAQTPGRQSVSYINLENREAISVNGDVPFVAASSIKVAYNTYLYNHYATGTISPDETMAYNSAPYPDGDYEPGTGTIQYSANGTVFPLSEVSMLSIRNSDNCATNMVIRRLGGIDAINENYMRPISNVVDYRQSVSYTDYAGNAQSGRHRTSAIDLARYMEDLYWAYKSNPSIYQPLIDDLLNTDFSWGIPAGVSEGTLVAHKIGFNSAYGTDNDVAIVFAIEHYIICVMTETGNAAQGQRDIAALTRLIDDYINACYATD